jgi:hypothetical protein
MAIVVVGGHSRNVGKTSVVAGLIAALSSYNWTAFKITQFGHGKCSLDGQLCHCATDDHTWAISEEKDRSGISDSSRFLCAGAMRSFWVRTEQGRLAEAMPGVRRRLVEAENAIIESNSILRFIRSDLYILVLAPGLEDFKDSAKEFLDRADAIIIHRDEQNPRWRGISLKPVSTRPVFYISPPDYVSEEIMSFVRKRMEVCSRCSP